MSPRSRVVLGSIVALLAVTFLLVWIIDTDAEIIERRTVEARDAVLAGDVEAVLAYLVANAEMDGDLGKRRIADVLPGYVRRASEEVEGISLSLREIAVDGKDASASWTVNVRMKSGRTVPFFRFRVRIEYRRDQDSWFIRHVEVDAS